MIVKLLTEHHLEFLSRRLQRLVRVYTCQNFKLQQWKSHAAAQIIVSLYEPMEDGE